MSYWFISGMGERKNNQAYHPSFQSLSELPAISACARQRNQCGVRNTLTEGLWHVKNRLIFFFFSPDNVLRSAESSTVETQTRPVLCEQNPSRHKSPVIPLFQCENARSAAPHPPTSYRSAQDSDRKAGKLTLTVGFNHLWVIFYDLWCV